MPPGAHMAGLDSQDCILHWAVSPVSRRLLGACRPVSGLLRTYPFLPAGLGPSPGRIEKRVNEVLRIASRARPPFLAVDFVDDLRLVDKGGGRERLFANLAQFLPSLIRLSVRYHTKEGERRRPRHSIPQIGPLANTASTEVEIEPSKRKKGMALREAIMALGTSARMSTRALLAPASFSNFL